MDAMNPVVFTFGCPRSNTTFTHMLVKATEPDTVVARLSEYKRLHPCKSSGGIVELADVFYERPVVVVRAVRDPLGCAESLLATRKHASRIGGKWRNSNDEIVEWITSESRNWAAQVDEVREMPHTEIIEVRYEMMADGGYRKALLEHLVGISSEDRREALRAHLDEFGRTPARPGRLQFSLGQVSTAEERRFFEAALAETRQREGYLDGGEHG